MPEMAFGVLVEMLVIGIGGITWILVLVLAFAGFGWIPVDSLASPFVVIAALATAYVVGIVVDAVADKIFDLFPTKRTIQKTHGLQDAPQRARARQLAYRDEFGQRLLDYHRSRLRIARGWGINCIMGLIAGNSYVWAQLDEQASRLQLSLGLTMGLLVLTAGCWFAWRQLTESEYKSIAGYPTNQSERQGQPAG